MATLFRRSNGIYYILYEEEGKRRWKSTGRRRHGAALKELTAFEQAPDQTPRCENLKDFIKELLKFCDTAFSPKTVELYQRSLQRFLAFTGNKPLVSCTARDVDLYRARRVTEVSPTSVNIELKSLKAAFNTAVRWGLLPENPLKNVPMVRVPDRQPAYLSKKDLEMLLARISEPWLREIIIIAVSTGLRRGELLNLRWSDLDFDRRLINVQSDDSFRTKGGKRRSVPMNELVFRILWKRAQRPLGEFVFTLHSRRIEGNWVTCLFRRHVRQAGLNRKLHFHSLRHTFATWLVQGGVSIYEVQKLLGHSKVSVTEIYSHLAASELQSAVNKISVSFN